MRVNVNALRGGERKRGFDRNRLLPLADYGWAQRPVSSPIDERGPASASMPPGQNPRKRVSQCEQASILVR
jgi:hypothetical protein